MRPKICEGLDGHWVGRKDGDLGGGVDVQIQLGLEDGGGKGSKVSIEHSGCDPNVSGDRWRLQLLGYLPREMQLQ